VIKLAKRKKLRIPRGKYKVSKKIIHRKAWTDRWGHRHSASTYTRPAQFVKRGAYLRPDVGKVGRTPKAERWFKAKEHTGWKKELPISKRRKLVLNVTQRQMKAGKYPKFSDPYLVAGRRMTALANVTVDKATKEKARADARYFYEKAKKYKGA